METNGKAIEKRRAIRKSITELPIVENSTNQSCNFNGYDADMLMKESAKLRKLITKKGTLEILIPLCCSTNPVRYIKFRSIIFLVYKQLLQISGQPSETE
jgi:hypothetical protein